MTNIKTVTNIAFGRELHYVVDNNYCIIIFIRVSLWQTLYLFVLI